MKKRIETYTITTGAEWRELEKVARNEYGDIVLYFSGGDCWQFTPQRIAENHTPLVGDVRSVHQSKHPRLSLMRLQGQAIFGDVSIIKPTPEPTPGAAVRPGWKRNKLTLKQPSNGDTPAVFGFGSESYTVPSGAAWATVCKLIEADAFDGHGLKMPTPSGQFKRQHRAFFSERMTRNESGWYIKTV